MQEAEEQPDRRRFSGTVRAEETEDLAGLDRQVEVRQRRRELTPCTASSVRASR
jgi:hypothetical protein